MCVYACVFGKNVSEEEGMGCSLTNAFLTFCSHDHFSPGLCKYSPTCCFLGIGADQDRLPHQGFDGGV